MDGLLREVLAAGDAADGELQEGTGEGEVGVVGGPGVEGVDDDEDGAGRILGEDAIEPFAAGDVAAAQGVVEGGGDEAVLGNEARGAAGTEAGLAGGERMRCRDHRGTALSPSPGPWRRDLAR
jgi:hypothetical protein